MNLSHDSGPALFLSTNHDIFLFLRVCVTISYHLCLSIFISQAPQSPTTGVLPLVTQPPISPDEEISALLPAKPPAEENFNWRKYGQKQVTGCEYPRSYYMYKQPDCPVRRKLRDLTMEKSQRLSTRGRTTIRRLSHLAASLRRLMTSQPPPRQTSPIRSSPPWRGSITSSTSRRMA